MWSMSKCHPALQYGITHIAECSTFIPPSGSPWAQPSAANIYLGSSRRWLHVHYDTGHVLDNTLRKGNNWEAICPGTELRLKYKWLLFHTSTSDDYSLDLLMKEMEGGMGKSSHYLWNPMFVSFKLQVYLFVMTSGHLFQYSQSSSSSQFCASCEAIYFKRYSHMRDLYC